MEIRERTVLDKKGRQRRTLISFGALGVIGALSATARALVGKAPKPKVEAEKEEFHRQAEVAKRAEEAAKVAKDEQAKKYAVVKAKEKPIPELSTDRARRQIKELKEELGEKFDITIEFNPRPQIILPRVGVHIHTFPGISEETRVGTFFKSDKTPGLLAIVSVYDEGNSTRYEWGVFRYEELKERNIRFKDKKPTVETKDWGKVVFVCLKEGDEVYMIPTPSK